MNLAPPLKMKGGLSDFCIWRMSLRLSFCRGEASIMIESQLSRTTRVARRKWAKSLTLLLTIFALSGIKAGHAQIALNAAPAGTRIGNQAAATYTDGSGTPRTATSNTVITIVQQVGSFTLTQDNTKPGAAGTTVYFPHTITNTGNGTDAFNIPTPTVAGGTFTPTNLAVYADENGDGVPDNFTPLTVTPNLTPGASYNFVVAAAIPAGTPDSGTATVNVDATSVFNGQPSTNDPNGNDDVITVTSNAVLEVTKVISANNGPSLAVANPATNPTYTYTLTYRNNGRANATDVIISDVLDVRFGYVPGSGRISAVAVTDAAGDDSYTYNAATSTVSVTIATIAPRQSGQITFSVTVDRGLTAPQVIPNTGTYVYDSDGNGSPDGSGSTNTVNFNVTPTADVTGTSPAPVTSASQGSTVPFNNTFTNTGTGADVFDVVINQATSTFPAGTTFALFKSDGGTPLIDTNGNGIPDTGTVAAGVSYIVVVQVTLPSGAPPTPNGPYTLTKTATSTNDPTKTATTTDTLNTITSSTVDLTNTNAPVGANGSGAGPEAAPVTTIAANPGTTTRFALSVNNISARTDNYDLSVSSVLGNPAAGTPGLTVVFRNAAGGVITNTGDVAAGATFNYFADVTSLPTAVPGTLNLYYRVLSPVSGASDRKFDALTVDTVRGIAVEPNNTGQAYPGNTVVYTHTVSNTGNVTETGVTLGLVDSSAPAGFTSTLYADTNNNGILDAGDLPITSIATLAPGANVTVFVSTFTPGNATPGQQNITTVTATSTGGTLPGGGAAPGTNPSDTATDTTTVVAGQLELIKEQALDANLDGTPDSGVYSTTPISIGANPGAAIRYRIRVRNIGTANVDNVIVSDTIPNATVYDNGAGTDLADGTGNAVWVSSAGVASGPVTPLVDGTTGSLSFNVGTLTPGQSVTVYFGARINSN
jgi:uncharacterized repeat protein (TIGR01451 family)